MTDREKSELPDRNVNGEIPFFRKRSHQEFDRILNPIPVNYLTTSRSYQAPHTLMVTRKKLPIVPYDSHYDFTISRSMERQFAHHHGQAGRNNKKKVKT